ncbi:hypothetical protein AK812_SmicGene12352 [Symbiodinium microadriaticum]|uniref:Uncharacterized protein n=1 Tax=Symbiodinium microadriaticum TaxID=2951 RepID=A0A1Q9EAP4_SYMMI|nr:hypothetical protein AK812_SmicGene12352 [Symbiodinium microadriaticum]
MTSLSLQVLAFFLELYHIPARYQIYRLIPKEELKVGSLLLRRRARFCASIAAVECFRRTGGDKLLLCLQDLGANIQVANQASLEDDKAGEAFTAWTLNNITGDSGCLLEFVAGVVLKAVDPDVLVKALAGLYQGMLMSLKFKFAGFPSRSPSEARGDRGRSLTDAVKQCLKRPSYRRTAKLQVTPVLVVLLPKDYHKWINQIINLSLKALAVHLAWKLQVILITIQGFSWASGGRCCKRFNPDESILDELIGLPLAAAGIWFQLKLLQHK